MIKDIPGFQSQNSLTLLRSGLYDVCETIFVSGDGRSTATFVEVFHAATSELCACDLIVVLPNSAVLFRDFCKMANGTWQDSNGLVGETLAALLPDEISAYAQAGHVVEAQFRLTENTISWI